MDFNQPKDSRFQGKIPDFVRDSEGFQMTCTGYQPVTDPSSEPFIILMFTEFCKQKVSNSATVLVSGADSTPEIV